MFDNLKSMGSLAGMMKELPRIKAKLEEVRERLGELVVEAETGGGAVRVQANGKLQVLKISVDAALISGLVDPALADDRTLAEDLIVGAVNAALTKAREAAGQEMSTAAADLGLPLPPGALEGMLS